MTAWVAFDLALTNRPVGGLFYPASFSHISAALHTYAVATPATNQFLLQVSPATTEEQWNRSKRHVGISDAKTTVVIRMICTMVLGTAAGLRFAAVSATGRTVLV
jgi:hypothetical protein